MASRASRAGNLQIFGGDSQDTNRTTATTSQEQHQALISDDEDDNDNKDSQSEMELCISGIDAVKISHFYKKDLENLQDYDHAMITKKPPSGQLRNVTIKGSGQYKNDIKRKVDRMKESVNSLSTDVVNLDVTKVDDVRKLAGEFDEDSGVLIYISGMERKVYVIADGYEKLRTTAHRVRVCLGVIATSTRCGRALENSIHSTSSQLGAKPKLYPDLSEMHTHEEPMDTDGASDVNDHRSSGNIYISSSYNKDRKPRHDQAEGQRSRDTDFKTEGARHYRSSSDERFNVQFEFHNRFKLKAYKASITNLNVDAIVNAANDYLMHGGGVAAVISKAAGYHLDRESKEYVDKNGCLNVGENCLTTAGNLKYTKVIHAVGPQWHDYDDKEKCLADLYKTVLNVLLTSEKERFRTVGMSSISAGIYAVPKELCADMYIQAVADFSQFEKKYPKELHIIDIDVSILKLVEFSYKKWKKDPISVTMSEALKQYLIDNPSAGGWKRQGHRRGQRMHRQFSEPSDKKSFDSNVTTDIEGLTVNKKGTTSLKWGGEKTIFAVNDSVYVHIYAGKIDKVTDINAVVCNTDTYFGTAGYIATALQAAFGEKYRSNFDKMKAKEKSNGILGYVYTCETGSYYAPYVMHLAMKSLQSGNEFELKTYQKGIFNVFQRAEKRRFEKIAIPLIGTGLIQTKPEALKSCCRCVLEALGDFCRQGKSKYLLEIHLVNYNKEITQMMRDVFEKAERSNKTEWEHSTSGTHSFHRGKSFEFEEGKHKDKQFSETVSSIRTYGSHKSDSSENESFDNLAKSRIRREADNSALSFSKSFKSDGAVHSEGATGEKKGKGNLKIFMDD